VIRWKSALPGSVRHAGALSAGTVAGQAALFLASPLLTRLYTPDEFGAFSVMLGVATLLATLCALSYPVAIPLASSGGEAGELLWATVLSSIVIAPLGAIAARWFMTGRDGSLDTYTSVGLVAATASILAVWTGTRALSSRENQFRSVSVSGIADSGVQASTQLGFGYFSIGSVGLSGGYLAGKLAAVGYLLWRARPYLSAPQKPFRAARKWARYSLWVTPTTLLNQASVTAVAPFVASLYGAGLAGQFSLATRMLAMPSALVGQAIATVLFPKIARMSREGQPTLQAVQSVTSALASVAWPTFAVTALLGPELFALVFGAEWREAGVAAAILSPWLALSLVSSPISSVATVNNRLGQLLSLGVLEASLRFGALALGASLGNWYLSVAAYSAAGCLISLYTIAWVTRLSGGTATGWLNSWRPGRWLFIGAVAVLAALKFTVPIALFVALAALTCLLGAVVEARTLLKLIKLDDVRAS
jgi:O-antigen/teichoic acid export membrane protein